MPGRRKRRPFWESSRPCISRAPGILPRVQYFLTVRSDIPYTLAYSLAEIIAILTSLISLQRRHFLPIISRPLKSLDKREVIHPWPLAYYFEQVQKSSHGSFEVVSSCRQ